MVLLLFLTCVNQFVYGSGKANIVASWDCNDEDPGPCYPNGPAGPDEKSPDAPITLSEEFIHEYHNPVNPDWISMLFQHKVHEAEKLCIFHPESFSPPPEA